MLNCTPTLFTLLWLLQNSRARIIALATILLGITLCKSAVCIRVCADAANSSL